jgi:hypothetical protein
VKYKILIIIGSFLLMLDRLETEIITETKVYSEDLAAEREALLKTGVLTTDAVWLASYKSFAFAEPVSCSL